MCILNMCPHKNFYRKVHVSIIHNSQKAETHNTVNQLNFKKQKH